MVMLEPEGITVPKSNTILDVPLAVETAALVSDIPVAPKALLVLENEP